MAVWLRKRVSPNCEAYPDLSKSLRNIPSKCLNKQEYWFAARTRKDQELTTRDALEKIGVEYFLPTQFVIRQLKYRRRRVEVPVIRNLIFVHATKEFACAIANEYGVRLFYMRDFDTKSMLIVPDKQMKDFMFVMNLDPAAVILNDDCFAVGIQSTSHQGRFLWS